jgi:hypothetical protein
MKLKNINIGILVGILYISFSSLNAQSISTGFQFGIGSSYIVENIESGSQFNYEPSFTTGFNFKYVPNEAYFGIKLNLLYVSTTYNGLTFRNVPYNGEVSSITTSLLLEHLNETKKWNWGYNFGMGFTREDFITNSFFSNAPKRRNFMSISVAGILSYKISEQSSLTLTPTILWTDPINTFRFNNWYSGGEDASVLFQFGYTYTFN